MADLMGVHIGLGEITGLAGAATEARLKFAEEAGVEIDLAVVRAIERTHRALRGAAGRTRRAGEHHEPRRAVGLTVLRENILPLHLGAAEHAGDEASGLVARRAGAALLLLRRPVRL